MKRLTSDKHQNMGHVNQIKCFECNKPGHIATHCYSKQNFFGKKVMKVKVTISKSKLQYR